MAVENKYTNIMSQHDDGSTALTIFADLAAAKSYFFTANALKCAVDHSTQVEYALVADSNNNNTKLKRTLGFDLSGQGQTYNNRMIELVDANDWGKPSTLDLRGLYSSVITTETSDHLF